MANPVNKNGFFFYSGGETSKIAHTGQNLNVGRAWFLLESPGNHPFPCFLQHQSEFLGSPQRLKLKRSPSYATISLVFFLCLLFHYYGAFDDIGLPQIRQENLSTLSLAALWLNSNLAVQPNIFRNVGIETWTFFRSSYSACHTSFAFWLLMGSSSGAAKLKVEIRNGREAGPGIYFLRSFLVLQFCRGYIILWKPELCQVALWGAETLSWYHPLFHQAWGDNSFYMLFPSACFPSLGGIFTFPAATLPVNLESLI